MSFIADTYRSNVDVTGELLSDLRDDIDEGSLGFDVEAKLAVSTDESEYHGADVFGHAR